MRHLPYVFTSISLLVVLAACGRLADEAEGGAMPGRPSPETEPGRPFPETEPGRSSPETEASAPSTPEGNVPEGRRGDSSGGSGCAPVTAPDITALPAAGLPSLTLHEGVVGQHKYLKIVGEDAIYETPSGLFAVPLNGGAAPTTIAAGSDWYWETVEKAVALWKGGTLSVWTRATGLVPMGPSDRLWFFFASADGKRIAYTESVAPGTFGIRVRNVADPVGSALLEVRDDLATAAPATWAASQSPCKSSMALLGETFFAKSCPASDPTASANKLVMVRADGAVVRLDADADAAPPTLEPGWTLGQWGIPYQHVGVSGDRTGTKLFVRRTDSSGAIITVGPAGSTSTLIEKDVAEGVMLPDGSAVIYRTAGGVIKKATTTSPPVITTLAVGAKGIFRLSPDAATILFHKLDMVHISTWQKNFDVSAVNHTVATPTVVTLVPTPTAAYVDVDGSSTHLILRRSGCSVHEFFSLSDGGKVPIVSSLSPDSTPEGGAAFYNGCPFGYCGPVTYRDFPNAATFQFGSDVMHLSIAGKRVLYSEYDRKNLYVVTLP